MKIKMRQSLTSGADKIFTIDCLDATDVQTAKNHEEIIFDEIFNKNYDLSLTKKTTIRIKIKSSSDFLSLLNLISCSNNIEAPMLCIHGHGDSKKGLQISHSNEFIPWHTLINSLSKIMVSKNGLLTVFGFFCHSFKIVDYFLAQELFCNHLRKNYTYLPFGYFYGYKSAVKIKVIEDEINIIFKQLFKEEHPQLFQDFKSLKITSYSEVDYCNSRFLSVYSNFVLGLNFEDIPKRRVRQRVNSDLKGVVSFKNTRKFLQSLKYDSTKIFGLIDKMILSDETRKIYRQDIIQHHSDFLLKKSRETN